MTEASRVPAPFAKGPDALMLLGLASDGGHEAWLGKDDVLRHVFVSGSTGSGKTNLLLGMTANAMAWGSGLLFVDGKGDISVYAQVCALARRYGREDSVLLLNFMGLGGGDPGASRAGRSNTVNPFRALGADELVQLVTGMMEEAHGDHAMWRGRAVAMSTAVIGAACWLRDSGRVELTPERLRGMMSLREIIELADPAIHPGMPARVRRPLASYLRALPGYQAEKRFKQAQTTLDQHGYLEMQLTRLFTTLGDVYGHVFSAGGLDVDFEDVVLNRRILVVLLPCLEKSREETESLGRLVVALLKNMMGRALATPVQGAWNQVVAQRRTLSDTPFLVILDEFGQYVTDGMDQMAAQARSLGFGMVFATQDMRSVENTNRRIYNGIMANTLTKVFMRSETLSKYEVQNFFPGESYDDLSHVRHNESRMRMLRDLLLDRIDDDALQAGLGATRAGIRREFVDLAARHLARLDELSGRPGADNLRGMAPGQMIVSRGADLMRVDAFDVVRTLEPVDLALCAFVRTDGDAFGHDAAAARLLSAPLPALGFEPGGLAAAEAETDAIRAAFAAIASAEPRALSETACQRWTGL